MLGFFRTIFGAFGQHQGYQNNLPLTSPVNGAHIEPPDSGVQISAVWACVDLIARTIASLPCDVYIIEESGRKVKDTKCNLSMLLSGSPNKYMTPYEFWYTLTMYRVMRGNAYAKIEHKADGSAYSINPLNPDQVNVKLEDGIITYEYTDANSQIHIYNANDIFHWKGMGNGIVGLSTLEYMRATLTEACDAQTNAVTMFANKGKLNGILTSKSILTPKQESKISEQFNAMRNGGIGVLPCDLEFQQLQLSPADTQLLETRKFSIQEIGRWFGVPSALINSAEGGDLESLTRHFYKATILPLCISAEQALMKRVACADEKRSHTVNFRLSFLNRASDSERYGLYSQAVQNGLLTRNECRRNEGYDDIEGADELTAQSNLMPLDKLGTQGSNEPQTPISQEPIKQ